MDYAWSIFGSLFLIGIGLAGFLRYEKLARDTIKNHEKHILGHPASGFEVNVNKWAIRLGGIVTIVVGIALLVKTLIG